MGLQFIIGNPGAGKTRRLYEDLIDRSLKERREPFIAVVPEQFTMQTQKEIVNLHPQHGTMNIDIVSFRRLAYRVFEELAVEPLTVLDDMGKSMVLRKVASEQKKNLGLFAGHLNQTGFINQLKSMLSELYQYGIRPEDLRRARQEASGALLREKLGDLAVVYEAFQKAIEERYITAEEILDVLCRMLPQSELIRRSVITLDNFTGFTPVQYRILELMMVYAKEVVVTVSMDPGGGLYQRGNVKDLFYMGKEMIFRLSKLAEKHKVERRRDLVLEGMYGKNPAIAYLEKHIYRYHMIEKQEMEISQENVEILCAAGPGQEAAAAAARIHQMVHREGIRYREIAVITGDLPGYRHELEERFQMEEIPFFMDSKKSILENVMVEFVRSALEIVQRDFDYESVFRFLKTGLMTEKQEELDRLENYVTALGIRGFKRWESPWEWVYKGGSSLNLEELNAFREELLEPLRPLREALKAEEKTVGSMTDAVIGCLETCRIRDKMEQYRIEFEAGRQYSLAKEYEQVYDCVLELLDRLKSLLGGEKVSLKEYAQILDAGLGEIQVGVIPATVDRVTVGDITRTRLTQIKALIVIGVNEGVIPVRKENGGLLNDMDREVLKRLNLELAPTSKEDGFMQRYYLYLLLGKPSCRLLLFYSCFDQAGKSRRPSSLIGEIQRILPELQIQEAEASKKEIYSWIQGKELLIQGLREREGGVKEESSQGEGEDRVGEGRFLELYQWFSRRPEYQETIKKLTEAAFYTYTKRGISRAAARALYGNILEGSVTRLEQYAACAYAHFLHYGLELMERQEYQIAAVDMGNMFHSSIDRCFRELERQGRSVTELDREEQRKLVKDCVGQVAQEYGNTIFQSSARNQFLAGRIERMTERTIWALAEQLKKGDFVPAGFEVAFSAVDNLQAMKIRLSQEEQLYLRGRIDRLDLCQEEGHVYVKIIDYKSGGTHFDLAAVYYGLQLQLVVYMDAVMELQERKFPDKEVVPAGIFYYNIKDPLVEKEESVSYQEVEAEILRQLRMNGLANSDLEVISHMDHEIEQKSDVIPVAIKDGLIQERFSTVAEGGKFEVLRQYVRARLKKSGQEILNGEISAEPYKGAAGTACDYCPYHGVCGFDTKLEGYRFRRFPELKPDEVWEKMEEAVN